MFNRYLWSAVLGAGDATLNKTNKYPCSCGGFILWEKTDNMPQASQVYSMFDNYKRIGEKSSREGHIRCVETWLVHWECDI